MPLFCFSIYYSTNTSQKLYNYIPSCYKTICHPVKVFFFFSLFILVPHLFLLLAEFLLFTRETFRWAEEVKDAKAWQRTDWICLILKSMKPYFLCLRNLCWWALVKCPVVLHSAGKTHTYINMCLFFSFFCHLLNGSVSPALNTWKEQLSKKAAV